MKRVGLSALLIVVAVGIGITWVPDSPDSVAGQKQPQPKPEEAGLKADESTTVVDEESAAPTKNSVSVQKVLSLIASSEENVNQAIAEIDRRWHPGSAAMLLESLRFMRTHHAFREAMSLLKKKTGQDFGRDFDSWYRWLWSRPYEPHPDYAKFKSRLYSRMDKRFSEYFETTADSKIRLDEIRWGGVVRDGIPPLKNPKMIPARNARYLADTDVVFGITLNGDARCYPKRILAWHEMFKDSIGTIPVCGAY